MPYIFERFYRAKKANYSGTGIGLTWTKQIVELLEGNIEVDNSKKNQVTFSVTIPNLNNPLIIALEEQRQQHNEVNALDINEEAGNLSDSFESLPHILVVEDNIEMQELLANVLKSNFKLDFAANGEIGEKKAIQLQPNLVLSDIMMPVKDGFELLTALKENFNTSHIPVVLLTARSDSKSRIVGLNQDADDYIEKPFDPVELKARVNNLLRQRKHLHKLFSENPLIYSEEIKCTPIDADFIDRARKILELHFANGDFSVNSFCQGLALNRTSVNYKIKALTNQSIAEYIKNFRLEKAVKMLIETNDSILEIATDSGFNNPQVFNKSFKKKFKNTPSLFRSEFGK